MTIYDLRDDTPKHERDMILALDSVLSAIDWNDDSSQDWIDYCVSVHTSISVMMNRFNLRTDYSKRDEYGRAYIVTNK